MNEHFMYDQCEICIVRTIRVNFVNVILKKIMFSEDSMVFNSIYHEKAFSFSLVVVLLLNCFHVFCYVFVVYFFSFFLARINQGAVKARKKTLLITFVFSCFMLPRKLNNFCP